MNKAGRPSNDFQSKRVSVPCELIPDVKKLIEQWKLNQKQSKKD